MRRHSSAAPLAWLYAALIVYASLSPFTGWRQPVGLPFYGLGHLPWSPWWTAFDVLSNLVGYVPLGVLVFGAQVRHGRAAWPAAWLTLFTGGALSLALESLQNYLPQRVPSSLDWGLNVAGMVLGVLLAALVRALGGVQRWQVLRNRWFVAHSAGGIALFLLWPVGLLFPTPVPFGVGQVGARLQELLAGWSEGWVEAHSELLPLSRGAEWVVIVLGLLAPCFVAFGVMRPGWRRLALALLAFASGLGASTLSTAMNFGPQHALAWLAPSLAPALTAAALLALVLVVMPRRAVAGLGLVALTVLVALVAQAPADPYYAESLQAWEQGRFIRFHGAAQWVGWLWPYAALLYLLVQVASRDDGS